MRSTDLAVIIALAGIAAWLLYAPIPQGNGEILSAIVGGFLGYLTGRLGPTHE